MSETRYYLQPIFDSYAVPLVVAALLFLLLWIRPAFANVSKRRMAILTALRGSAILGLLIAMVRPTIVNTETKPLSASFALLFDASRSMQTEDVQDASRWSAAQQLLENVSPELQALEEAYEVRCFTFSSRLQERSPQQESEYFSLPETADGGETDIGAALDGVIRDLSGKRLGGVMLVSDGAQRSLAPRFDATQMARQLARQGCPIYTVTLGKSRDLSEARDISIENFEDQYTVFAKNELVLRASVFAQGYVGTKVPVELNVTSPDGTEETVGSVVVTPAEDSESMDVRFRYTPTKPGQYQLTLTALERPGERVTDNNSLGAFLNVVEGGIRVLYLSGNIGWQEHNLIRRSIDESQDIQLDFQWIDVRRRRQWPVDLRPLLKAYDYDVFILADLDAAALGRKQIAELADLVEEGKGLLMTGGMHSLSAGGYSATKFAEVLPIQLGRFGRQEFGEPMRRDLHIEGSLELRPTAPHFTTRLSNRDDPGPDWSELPPLRGANQIRKLKPTATLLLETTAGDPILVQGQYGLGRTLAFAGDSTYRWYRYGFEEAHQRFWRQLVVWLAKREDESKNEVWLRMDQRRYAAGAKPEFEIGVTDEQGDEIEGARFEVKLISPSGRRSDLPVVRQRRGNKPAVGVGVSEAVIEPGTYTIRAEAFRDAESLGTTESQFIVLDQDLELADTTANPAAMQMLSDLTRDAGGKSFAPEQVEQLLRDLREKPITSTTQLETRWQLTDTAVDAWLVFLMIAGVLSTEWFLRKRWAMV